MIIYLISAGVLLAIDASLTMWVLFIVSIPLDNLSRRP